MKDLLTCAMDIGEQMLVCGAEVHRVEDSIQRMCLAMGASRIDIFIITSSMVATVQTPDGETVTQTRRIKSTGTDIERLDLLNSHAFQTHLVQQPVNVVLRQVHHTLTQFPMQSF